MLLSTALQRVSLNSKSIGVSVASSGTASAVCQCISAHCRALRSRNQLGGVLGRWLRAESRPDVRPARPARTWSPLVSCGQAPSTLSAAVDLTQLWVLYLRNLYFAQLFRNVLQAEWVRQAEIHPTTKWTPQVNCRFPAPNYRSTARDKIAGSLCIPRFGISLTSWMNTPEAPKVGRTPPSDRLSSFQFTQEMILFRMSEGFRDILDRTMTDM